MSYTAAVITVSDKGARGERKDTSGPALCAMLDKAGWKVVYTAVVPDEAEAIRRELLHCADELGAALVLTTGGTGFSPRDITPEATRTVLERECPGIGEAMRAASMAITPKGCLSRELAGIRGRTLIINLPGSEKASTENFAAVIGPVEHGVEMLLGEGSANCGEHEHHHHDDKKAAPSMDEWLKQAKAEAGAERCGMYLLHNGVVRATARAAVRGGDAQAAPVGGMLFSCDADKLAAAVASARGMEGIFHVRAWVNEGELSVGDDIMLVLVGGDIRPHVLTALETLVGTIKNECVTEREIAAAGADKTV